MDIQKEDKFEALPEIEMMLRENPDIKFENGGYVYHGLNQLMALAVCYVAGAWMAWQAAKAQAVPEGFILVPKEPTEAMIQRGTKANSECLNENAPLGERLFRHPALQVYQAMVNGSGE